MEQMVQNLKDLTFLRQQLGREPRGFLEVYKRNRQGYPSVIQVSPLVEDKPFPTLFWLTDPELVKNISRIEATGAVKVIENELSASKVALQRHLEDQRMYHQCREQLCQRLFDEETCLKLREAFLQAGVGGISNWQRVRCLHMFYASHLVIPNFVGQRLDESYNLS